VIQYLTDCELKDVSSKSETGSLQLYKLDFPTVTIRR
jgi:hypothetical protein